MRKLDAAIAEALGNRVRLGYLGYESYMKDAAGNIIPFPHYSTDGNAMLELIGEMTERQGFILDLDLYLYPSEICSLFWRLPKQRQITYYSKADTLPLAVALAAYKALTGKEWSE